jgi:hypothetical protein
MIRPTKLLTTLALGLACGTATQASPLLNFQFNEGTGSTTVDSVSGLVGVLGAAQDPSVDTVQLVDQSPSGQTGDRSIITSGSGFLLADDSATQAFNITNGPITMESWVYIDPATPAKAAEGILAYGNSYKMGLRSGIQVFTLYGKVDVVNNAAGPIPAGQWVHLAAAWEPGTGVHFYVDGVESFVEDTNTVSRPITHNYLSLASEGLGNNSVATFDRMRLHHALLTADQIDSVAATPKPTLPTTLASFDFDQQTLPATNSVAPQLSAVLSHTLLPALTGPAWTNDTPTGAEGDFAIAFLKTNPPVKEVVTVDYGDTPIDLSANNSSYTLQSWVKVPTGPMEERRVILRTDGPAPRVALSINANRTLHTTVLGTADFTTSVQVPNDNRWHHIAVVMEDFAQLRFYLDGALRQTVARTQTGAPSSGGTARLMIGKESETRFFNGILDRVIINNDALAQTALDYPARIGLPTFAELASHPANVTVAAGQSAVFTATPTSDSPITSQQWFYRTNLSDVVGVPIQGETSTTLTLNTVTDANEGFYYLVVSNSVGGAESYAGELTLNSSFALAPTGFEPPTYTSGPIEGQDRWTNDANGNAVRVLTVEEITDFLEASGIAPGQPVHSGDQALVVSGPLFASTTIRRITGLESETDVTVDFWVRPLSGASVGNVFITAENAAGTRAGALRFGPNNSIDYGTAIQGVWQATGLTWDANTWYQITMKLDYESRTYDFLVNGTAVNTSPIPFYTATADSFSQLRIFRGTGQAGLILDDLSIAGADVIEEPILGINRQGADLVISWPSTSLDFTLQATDRLDQPSWTTVPHTTQGAENQATVQATGTMRLFRLIGSN